VRLLLDTCTFLWIVSDDPALSGEARAVFADPANEVFLSAVSVWEIVVKHALGRLPLPDPPMQFIPAQRTRHGIQPLPLAHGLALLTPDEAIRQYPVRALW
jgi:PIN domain nuclease of toxin-antitoxin system